MTKKEKRIVETFCTNPDEHKKKMIEEKIQSVNSSIAQELYKSIVLKQSYAKQNMRNYIPIGEKDFYGYRRKAIHAIYKAIVSQELRE